MKAFKNKLAMAFFIMLISSTQSYAANGDWIVTSDPFGGSGHKVENTKTGQILTTNFKNKRKAKKAAKALNKADKGVRDLHEPGCNQPGVVC